MKRVIVVHPDFDVVGGAERVASCVIQWLVMNSRTDVTLLCLSRPGAASLVKAGISEGIAHRLNVRVADCPAFIRRSRGTMHLLRLAFLHRSARSLCREYDVCVSTYNELDFGKRGIQYVHHPSFADRDLLREMHILGRRSILDKIPFLNSFYRLLVSLISGDKKSGFANNITLVNSFFMRDLVKEVYGISGEVVYPAAQIYSEDLKPKPWDERASRFVTISRIAPDKNLLNVIDDFSALQREFPDAEFVILGASDDSGYESLITLKAKERNVRLRIEKSLTDAELRTFLANTKYYIHARVNEHFGIAVVEALAAGCLVMVHDSGGPREIVERAELRFKDADDLVKKVTRLNEEPLLRSQVMTASQSGLDRFTLQAFYSRLDSILRPFLDS